MTFHFSSIAAGLVALMATAAGAQENTAPNIHMATLAVITTEDAKKCGGVPIGATLVMTAAHCVTPEGAVDPIGPEQIKLTISAYGADPVPIGVADVAIPHGFKYQGIPTREVVGNDVALLRLSSPLTVPFELVAQPPGALTHTALRSASTSQDTPVEVCSTLVETGNVMALECARAPGSSGSPVFAVIDGRRTVIGIISAGGERRDGSPMIFAAVAQPNFSNMSWLLQDRGAITGF